MLIFSSFLLLLRRLKVLFMYFITVNKYRFCILVIGYINIQIIVIGYKNLYWSITKPKVNLSLVKQRACSSWARARMVYARDRQLRS